MENSEVIAGVLREKLSTADATGGTNAAGHLMSSGDGIAFVSDMTGVKSGELVTFSSGAQGIAINLESDRVGIAVLYGNEKIQSQELAIGTGKVLEIPVGDAMLGRVVNPLGEPIDGGQRIITGQSRPVEFGAPGIMERGSVNRTVETGILAIDAMIPIGRGQRELIIGDRQTGKSAIAIDTILNQKGKKLNCIYVAIGQKASKVAEIERKLRAAGAMEYTVIVCASASDSASMQYIAPYAGCAIGEYFMYTGRDALVIYDDLSKHAVAYRAISLLLKRPPGREAYPGDVFYLHSRLLERAAQLSKKNGGGSLTALPIIETLAGDISAYIPTNVISITDGQIFLDSSLFRSGIRPSINVGLSVSRVGGSAQFATIRGVSGRLRLDLAQYRELAVFAQFGSDLDSATRRTLKNGERLVEALKQPQYLHYSMPKEAVVLYVLANNLCENVEPKQIVLCLHNLIDEIDQNSPDIWDEIEKCAQIGEKIDEVTARKIKDVLERLA